MFQSKIVAALSGDNNSSLKQFIITQVVIFAVIQVSFKLSLLFNITQEKLHILSFTGALIVASVIRFNWRILPSIMLSLFFYYVFVSGRPLYIATLFSVFLPLVPFGFSLLYKRLLQEVEEFDYTKSLAYYVGIIGLLYPLFNALFIWLISYHLGTNPELSFKFLVYSVVSGALTQTVLTPIVCGVYSYLFDKEEAKLITLDRQMYQSAQSTFAYKSWFMGCVALAVIALVVHDHLLVNTISFTLLCIAGAGFGKFGIIRPLLFSALSMLVCIESVIYRYNNTDVAIEHLYGILLILFTISMIIFMLGANTIKNFVMTRNAVRQERIDAYTGLFNVSQLKEDIHANPTSVLIYIDLEPTLSKLSGLGHHGRAQLMRQLSDYLKENTEYLQRSYLPPFARGLVCFAPYLPYLNAELKRLIEILDGFRFYFNGSSIELVQRSIQCTQVEPGQDVESLVSLLCDQISSSYKSINWVDASEQHQDKLDKLSFIQQCFKQDKFELFCQPYQNLAETEKGHYLEVLIRLNSESGSIMSPAEFFPLIDEFGLEVELDEWVIRNTFKMLSDNVSDWDAIGRVSINLTANALNTETLATSIETLAELYHVPLSAICFELTESDALRDESIAISNINALHDAGCKIALDDFGTGYASFDYLKKLPLDILKIDGAFVREIVTNDTDKIIVQAMSQVAQSMSLKTVAEFVESPEHIEVLKSLDIHFAQGFGVAKPRPLRDFLDEIR